MKKLLSVLLCLSVFLSLFGCTASSKRYTSTFVEAFDTVTTVVAYDTSEEHYNSCVKLVEEKLNEYSRLFDIYREYEGVTNLCTINKTAGKAPVKADREIIALLAEGKKAYAESSGRLNICFGAVLSLWHEARETALKTPEKAYVPEMKKLKEASLHTNPDDLITDEENGTVFFKDSALKLDVGATAKGYAAEKLAEFIKEKNLWTDFMLNLGGNVVTCGFKNSDGRTKWNIQIENPDSESPLESLSLTGLSVVTSGDYQRYFTFGGKRYCHIIDPETLMPAEYFTSVTVITESSALADRLSTELFLMPVDEGLKYIETLDGTEAVWADKNGSITCTSGFEQFRMR